MRISINVLLLLAVLGSSCQNYPVDDDDIDIPNPKDSSEIKVVWQTAVFESTSEERNAGYMMKPIIYDGKVLTSHYKRLSDDTEEVIALNKASGERMWVWSDFLSPGNGERSLSIIDRPLCNNLMYYSTEEANYIIDMNAGHTYHKENGRSRSNPHFVDRTREGSIDCLVLQPRQFGVPGGDSVHLYLRNMVTGEKRIIYKTYKVNSRYPVIETPVIWYVGDSLYAAFSTIYLDQNLIHNKDSVSLTCLNLSNGSVSWKLENYDPNEWSNVHGPKFDESLLYVVGRYAVYCVDALSGDIVWEWRDESFGSLHTGDIQIHDKNLFFKSSFGFVICLNKMTGEKIWEVRDTKKTGVASMRMTYYNGYLLFSDGRLIIMDAETGESLEIYTSPNKFQGYNSTIFSHITVDPSTGLIYAGDGYFMMCLSYPW